MLNKFFPVNEYQTSPTYKRIIWDRLFFGTSIYFNFSFLKIIIRNRKLAFNNKYNREQWASSSVEIFRLLELCGSKIHIEGFDHLDTVKDEPVVFICNHMGTLETMIFPGLIAPVKEVTFVVKDNLAANPIFGPIMRARNPITVGRSDSRHDLMKVIADGKQKLAEGTSVVIFPQGTRATTFNPKAFNSLGVKLAQKARVRIIPMAIKTDFWANGKIIKDLGYLQRKEPVHIKFGEPMEVEGNGKEQQQYCIDFIQSNLDKWNNV